MKTKTAKALAGTQYILKPENYPALVAAVDYAAQNPGLEWRNYSSGPNDEAGRKAYCAEARAIRKDWLRVIGAVHEADRAGVTDADVIKAAPAAFSGRLGWLPASKEWGYCTGQYWPTEYRKAVASVIERATHNVLQARPVEPLPEREYSLAEIKAITRSRGGYFFSNAREGERLTKLPGNRIRVVHPAEAFCNQVMPEHVAVFKWEPATGSFEDSELD